MRYCAQIPVTPEPSKTSAKRRLKGTGGKASGSGTKPKRSEPSDEEKGRMWVMKMEEESQQYREHPDMFVDFEVKMIRNYLDWKKSAFPDMVTAPQR